MHNPDNERIKRAYFIYLKEARRLGEHSIEQWIPPCWGRAKRDGGHRNFEA